MECHQNECTACNLLEVLIEVLLWATTSSTIVWAHLEVAVRVVAVRVTEMEEMEEGSEKVVVAVMVGVEGVGRGTAGVGEKGVVERVAAVVVERAAVDLQQSGCARDALCECDVPNQALPSSAFTNKQASTIGPVSSGGE
jgi:hypothetical protein